MKANKKNYDSNLESSITIIAKKPVFVKGLRAIFRKIAQFQRGIQRKASHSSRIDSRGGRVPRFGRGGAPEQQRATVFMLIPVNFAIAAIVYPSLWRSIIHAFCSLVCLLRKSPRSSANSAFMRVKRSQCPRQRLAG